MSEQEQVRQSIKNVRFLGGGLAPTHQLPLEGCHMKNMKVGEQNNGSASPASAMRAHAAPTA